MKCKNCGNEKEEHYIAIIRDRTKKLKNALLFCYPLRNYIKPNDKRYFMKFEGGGNEP